MDIDRRQLLKQSALGALTFKVGGATLLLTPREAKARALAPSVLTPDEVHVLEAFAEVLVPGAREAGVAQYVDNQLGRDPGDRMFVIRHLDVPPPHGALYKAGLAALDKYAGTRFGVGFPDLSPEQGITLVREISASVPDGWQGPPSPLLYFVVRSDAVDVVYGTMEGFERLGVPYMAHIEPPAKW